MSEEETPRTLELEDMFAVLPALRNGNSAAVYNYDSMISEKVDNPYISNHEPLMSKDQIIEYLLSNDVLGEEVTSWYRSEVSKQREATAA